MELSHCVVVDVCLCHVRVKDLIILWVKVETWVLVFGDVSPLATVLLLCLLLLEFYILLINLGQLVLFSCILIASWSLPLTVAAYNLGDTALTEQEVEGHIGLHGSVVLPLELFPTLLCVLTHLLLLLDALTGGQVVLSPSGLLAFFDDLKVEVRLVLINQ